MASGSWGPHLRSLCVYLGAPSQASVTLGFTAGVRARQNRLPLQRAGLLCACAPAPTPAGTPASARSHLAA